MKAELLSHGKLKSGMFIEVPEGWSIPKGVYFLVVEPKLLDKNLFTINLLDNKAKILADAKMSLIASYSYINPYFKKAEPTDIILFMEQSTEFIQKLVRKYDE